MILALSVMFSLMCLASVRGETENAGPHLFILSGQSNMAGLKPEESFTPAVEEAFGKKNVIVVKDALGGATDSQVVQGLEISRWQSSKIHRGPV